MTDVAAPAAFPEPVVDRRTRRLLDAPFLPLLIRLAWPTC